MVVYRSPTLSVSDSEPTSLAHPTWANPLHIYIDAALAKVTDDALFTRQ